MATVASLATITPAFASTLDANQTTDALTTTHAVRRDIASLLVLLWLMAPILTPKTVMSSFSEKEFQGADAGFVSRRKKYTTMGGLLVDSTWEGVALATPPCRRANRGRAIAFRASHSRGGRTNMAGHDPAPP